MVEEWCGDSGGGSIPLIIVPLWDAELAADEIRRNAERGVHAVTFCEIPPHLGLPSIHSGDWDPFFRACEETGTVVNMHIGSSSKMPATRARRAARGRADADVQQLDGVDDRLALQRASSCSSRTCGSRTAKGQIGWIPYVLERVDDVWERAPGLGRRPDTVPEPPSTYYYRTSTAASSATSTGIASLDEVGEDNITFETDYPHTDSTWPDTKEVAGELLARRRRRRGVQDRARQRDPHAPARPHPVSPWAGPRARRENRTVTDDGTPRAAARRHRLGPVRGVVAGTVRRAGRRRRRGVGRDRSRAPGAVPATHGCAADVPRGAGAAHRARPSPRGSTRRRSRSSRAGPPHPASMPASVRAWRWRSSSSSTPTASPTNRSPTSPPTSGRRAATRSSRRSRSSRPSSAPA